MSKVEYQKSYCITLYFTGGKYIISTRWAIYMHIYIVVWSLNCHICKHIVFFLENMRPRQTPLSATAFINSQQLRLVKTRQFVLPIIIHLIIVFISLHPSSTFIMYFLMVPYYMLLFHFTFFKLDS